ncbi:MAG: choice-of-anchor tandem repeat GloVer-containing protein [Candidatus Sulfotelmatobacter sp.]
MKTGLLWIFCVLPVLAAAQTYTYSTLANFPKTGGPFGATYLTIDAHGNLYGTSPYGGKYSENENGGDGTLYKVTPSGTVKVLLNFGSSATDGVEPVGPLTRDAAGNFYGTTLRGGSNSSGTIFKVSPAGAETVVFSFPNNNEGAYTLPAGGVTLDSAGNIYGYAYGYAQDNPNGGEIFRLTTDGVYSILHTWCAGVECYSVTGSPVGTLVLDGAGGFYGGVAGLMGIDEPAGDVFKFSARSGMDVLYGFEAPAGAQGTPVVDAKGDIFGIEGSSYQEGGGIYEISASGIYSTIFTLPSDYLGEYNGGAPILDASGNLYDTGAIKDGPNVVYEVSSAGVQTVLYSGSDIQATGVVMDNSGNLYGTCYFCGTNSTGSIGKLTKSAR